MTFANNIARVELLDASNTNFEDSKTQVNGDYDCWCRV
ncbi:hypothetical protein DDE82_003245 [Stemphylium lycopersici]|uniref:Uncharacterized protein n=1 Tax=Stemphylium lycopersici TaxID=183478 RepID=A0A364N413_STELY|nr:hypothetical protein TW65_02166 [Stemphylium lycopersici]RAR06709.1 hypothetical protein DDE82_003245 [Stemphylium lycopersici]RAR11424.1 hypothetical protein DDE83_004570 [Stemphylium lycopersici]